MYKVFIVEDEIVTREGIRNNIPWDETVFTLAGEAPDGEMALHAIRDLKPDILITDIKMPFMDGLELSRIVKDDFPWIKIIILSGHDEFHYARQAISIGVEEYLLKPASSEDMLKSLLKIARSIEQEKKQLQDMENLKQQVLTGEEMVRDKWFLDMITGQMNSMDILKSAKTMNLDLLAERYVVLLTQISPLSDNTLSYSPIQSLYSQILNPREDVLFYSQSTDKFIILMKQKGTRDMDDSTYSLAQAIKHEVERNAHCLVSVGIGSMVNHLGEIFHSYQDAEKVLRHLLLTGSHKIIGIHDLKGFASLSENNQDFKILQNQVESHHQNKIVQAKQYIEEKYGDPDISLSSVAAHVHVSPNHFSTLFSQEEKITFIEYLTSVRIKYAKQLLTLSNMKCADISFEVGYSDPHYFSFIFKKNTGLSPREFRSSQKVEC